MQIHETSTLRLTDRDISSSAYETQAGNQTPLGGCQVLAPSPLPRGTVPGAENYLAYPIRPWTTVVKYASSRFNPRPRPLCSHCFPLPGASTPGHTEPFLTMDVAPPCPSEDRPFLPCPLGGNHKNKAGASSLARNPGNEAFPRLPGGTHAAGPTTLQL